MARLPATVGGLDAPRGMRPSGEQPRPTDLGLGAVGENLADYAQAKKKTDDVKDDLEARRLLDEQVKPTYEPAQAQRAETFDWSQSGYAQQELGDLEAVAKPVLDAAPSTGVRNALSRRLDAYKAQVGDHVINVESVKRAEPVREQRLAVEALDRSNAVARYLQINGDLSAKRLQTSDPSMHGYMAGALEDHDAAAKQVLDETPDDKKPALMQTLAAERARVAAGAYNVEEKGRVGAIVTKFKTGSETLVNGVVSNPAGFDAAKAQVAEMAGALPGPMRADIERETLGNLAEARVEGFILQDNTATAKKELTSGRFDDVLPKGKKEQLLARIEAAETRGPKSLADWQQAYALEDRMKAAIEARATTGKRSADEPSLDEITRVFGAKKVAEWQHDSMTADRTFVAIGDVRAKPMDALRAQAAAPAPDPADPDYAVKRQAWELGAKAAALELKARSDDPAGWAQRSAQPGDWQNQNQQRWSAFVASPAGEGRVQAGRAYAASVLGIQEKVGIAPNAQRIFSKDQAAQLADQYANAPPEQRREALIALAAVVHGLPSEMHFDSLGSQRMASPQEMAVRELDAAGLARADISAVADLQSNPGAMAAFVRAASNPAAKAHLDGKGREDALENAVDRALKPFLQTANTAEASAMMNAGRRERVLMVARDLVTQGIPFNRAATQAAADLNDFKFVDGYRVPASLAEQRNDIRKGAALALMDLTGNRDPIAGVLGRGDAPELLAPLPGVDGRPLPDGKGAEKARAAAREQGRWVTTEDDTGLMLMLPTADKGWRPMQDKFGRAITLSWSQLQARSSAKDAGAWFHPPSAALAPAQPSQAAEAMARAVTAQETGGLRDPRSAVSPKGALGVMQLMPDTAKAAAGRLGVAFDAKRLTTDAGYNQQLGREELRFLSQKYGGNVALVAAAYNAGPGRVDEWIKRFGDPRKGVSADIWVSQIPFDETRQYVRDVLPRAYRLLK